MKNKYLKAILNKKFAVDAIAMGVFWTIAYTPVYLYTSKSLDAALIGLAASALLEIGLGGVYGKFNDWLRRKFNVS
jgi:hypothetical protein